MGSTTVEKIDFQVPEQTQFLMLKRLSWTFSTVFSHRVNTLLVQKVRRAVIKLMSDLQLVFFLQVLLTL